MDIAYKKILAVLTDNTTVEMSFKVLWRMSKGSRSKFVEILRAYTKVTYWDGISDEDFDYHLDCILAEYVGDGAEIEWSML